MIDTYRSKYTPNGYSIKHLRNKAKKLKSKEGLSHTAALDRVAQEIKYSGWAELIGQKPNSKRDEFFGFMYQERFSKPERDLYRNYLDRNDLPDNKNSYRLFVLKHWEKYQQCGISDIEFSEDPLHPDELLKALESQLMQHGARALIPQQMESHTLESLIWAGLIIFEDAKLPETQGYFECFLLCLAAIRAYQTQSIQVGFEKEEFEVQIREYHTMCHMELMSRRTRIDVILPEINDMFKPDYMIGIKFPADFDPRA